MRVLLQLLAARGFYGYPQELVYSVGNTSDPYVQYAEAQLPIFKESGE
jgi:hypothetical protein